jgi:hypothetical protein
VSGSPRWRGPALRSKWCGVLSLDLLRSTLVVYAILMFCAHAYIITEVRALVCDVHLFEVVSNVTGNGYTKASERSDFRPLYCHVPHLFSFIEFFFNLCVDIPRASLRRYPKGIIHKLSILFDLAHAWIPNYTDSVRFAVAMSRNVERTFQFTTCVLIP